MPTNHTIRVLPIHVANKIAAGEVVDRPASVLKELLENAIDAAATQVDVEITAGGRKLVAVEDDGHGMDRDNALLSVERQATSKIKDVDDIEHIETLGFRGEALAAIASVSRFRLTTRSDACDVGTELTISGGRLTDVRDVGSPTGTRIEVRDLFFNVPARRKFLRAQQTELTHLRSCFIVQALAHPAVGMSLTVDGREAYRVAGNAAIEDRIRELFGMDYSTHLKSVSLEEGEVLVAGFVSDPSFHRSDRNEQFFFVNGRATSAALLNYALREGYHSIMAADRQPSVFLFLTMDSGLVDVNVHPTKKEVRFRHPSAVRDAVIRAIRDTLGATGLAAQPGEGGSASGPWGHIPDGAAAAPAVETTMQIDDLPRAQAFRYPGMPMAGGWGASKRAVPAHDDHVASSTDDTGGTDVGQPWSWCRVLGQIGSLYVVLETEDGYALMDPHAAHERVLYERFMRELEEGQVSSQGLLVPETVELPPKDALRVRKQVELIKKMGFGIADFGGDSFVIDALPGCFSGASASQLLVEIAEHLETAGARGGSARWREESICQAACKAAIKARDRLSLEEIERLVVDLARCEMPYTCPHGRPTVIFTSYDDLNKKFGRL